MIIIIDEDDTFRFWLDAHPEGFVVNAHRKPDAKYLILHRANCLDINSPRTAHWTTDYIKLCAQRVDELENWAAEQVGGKLQACQHCHPTHRRPHRTAAPLPRPVAAEPHLTRLGSHLLDYLLELTAISLDSDQSYADRGTTINAAATYFQKTPLQLMSAVRRLSEDGYLDLGNDWTSAALDEQLVLFPSTKALRTLPFFASMTDEDLCSALAKLRR